MHSLKKIEYIERVYKIQIDLKYDANFLFLDDSFKQTKQCLYEYIDLIPSISVSLPSIIQL